ncbi:hypothetical protein [Halococcus sp. IIIV-5B]|uniref:hypothetical protein n=1 Tax=Halococcus sp. IIIV-5B TaxID=2321230 RepID=UPI001F320766|nr:hypothetical protein [Halococcus sp. IIIV-5B]
MGFLLTKRAKTLKRLVNDLPLDFAPTGPTNGSLALITEQLVGKDSISTFLRSRLWSGSLKCSLEFGILPLKHLLVELEHALKLGDRGLKRLLVVSQPFDLRIEFGDIASRCLRKIRYRTFDVFAFILKRLNAFALGIETISDVI